MMTNAKTVLRVVLCGAVAVLAILMVHVFVIGSFIVFHYLSVR